MTKRALITGASSGIGRATAIAFAQAGYGVTLLGRSQPRLEQVAARIQPLGVDVEAIALDLLDLAAIPAAIATVCNGERPLDVLVNNAGMAYTGNLAEMPLEEWERLFRLNLTSVLCCCQAVLPTMRSRGQGTIINVSSVAAHSAFPEWGAYCASKAGLVMFSKALAAEERSHGLRVSVVSPGSVNTELWDTDTVHADFDRSKMLRAEVIARTILQVAELPPEAVVEEITVLPAVGTF